MLLVIFGAGASYDCADVQRRPPLAKDLVDPAFDSVAARFPECRAIVDRLRERMDGATSLELELAELATESRSRPERRRQLAAFRFYVRNVIEDVTIDLLRTTSGYTRYLRLMNFLYDWHRTSGEPIRIATFNYDTLLEDALETVFGGLGSQPRAGEFHRARRLPPLQAPRIDWLESGGQGAGRAIHNDALGHDDALGEGRHVRWRDRAAHSD